MTFFIRKRTTSNASRVRPAPSDHCAHVSSPLARSTMSSRTVILGALQTFVKPPLHNKFADFYAQSEPALKKEGNTVKTFLQKAVRRAWDMSRRYDRLAAWL